MADERFIVAIGRIERALSRIEQMDLSSNLLSNTDLADRHNRLKIETQAAIQDLNTILAGEV